MDNNYNSYSSTKYHEKHCLYDSSINRDPEDRIILFRDLHRELSRCRWSISARQMSTTTDIRVGKTRAN